MEPTLKIEHLVPDQVFQDALSIALFPLEWDRLKDKTLLITGANGFISYYLGLALMVRNDLFHDHIKILGLVRNFEKAEKKYAQILSRKEFQLIVQDVCTPLDAAPHADFVIHAASQATPSLFENDPLGTLNANTTGTLNVLQYAYKERSASVLVISSLKVYGTLQNGTSCFTEDKLGDLDIINYKNCYAQGKRTAEMTCACFCKQFGLSVKIARPSYIYGASSMQDDRVWAQFLGNILRGQAILLKSNGAAYRSFCYVTDAATALLKILLKGEDATPYNIASSKSNTTIRHFARIASRIFPERRLKLVFAHPADEADPSENFSTVPEILDSTRLESLGWYAQTPLEEGIRKALVTMEQQRSLQ